MKVSAEDATRIESQTRSQGSSTEWISQGEWRLTASKFGEIVKTTARRDLEKFCESLYDPPNLINVPAVRHGRTYEATALEKFSEVTGKKLLQSGLCIHPDFPYLGASPDSFVQDEDAVVEIKCPYKSRKCKIDAGEDIDFLERVGDCLRLKRGHNYYYQLTGQMKLAQKNHCYFCVYTFEDSFFEKITLDNEFFMNTMLPKLKAFYDNVYYPYVASKL